MTIGQELVDRLNDKSNRRIEFEAAWRDILDLAFPLGGNVPIAAGGLSSRKTELDHLSAMVFAARRSPDLYDTTLYEAINTTASGVEGFMTPRGRRWTKLAINDVFGFETTHTEDIWLDRLAGYMHAARYDTDSGFAIANSRALRSTTALGTGVLMSESTEDLGKNLGDPFIYTFIPLSECYLDTDDRGRHNENFRWFSKTVRQVVQRYGYDNVSAAVRTKFENPDTRDEHVEILHATMLRDEKGMRGNTNRDSQFASFVVEIATKHMIMDGGFFTFPYTIYTWNPSENAAYGETPVMALIANQKSLNNASFHQDIAVQQAAAPPMATTEAYDVDLNPRAVNVGLLDKQGNLKVRPVMENSRADISQSHIEVKKADIRQAMGVHLWTSEVGGPQKTATEMLIRDREKVQLLGPTGNIIQEQQGKLVEREMDIIGRRGAFEADSPLSPPQSVIDRGADIKVEFISPYDAARNSDGLIAIQQTYEAVAMSAQIDPDIRHRWDGDKAVQHTRTITDAPADILRDDDTYNELVEQDRQARQLATAAQTAQQGANAAKTAAEAQAAANESGLADGPIGEAARQAMGGAA